MSYKTWFAETRPAFLILTPVCYLLGVSIAYNEGHLNVPNILLGLLGAMCAHIGVNVLNDYFDYRSTLDLKTNRTPFSGGSGILPKGLMTPKGVFLMGIASLVVGAFIGVSFIVAFGLSLLPLVLAVGAIILLYTPMLTRIYVGEFAAGLGFGPLMSLGAYFIQTGEYSLRALQASIIPGILVAALLFLNEVPDVKADSSVGRRNLVILLGEKRSSQFYAVLLMSVYLSLILGIWLGSFPVSVLVAFLTLPIALRAIQGVSLHYDNPQSLIPAMADNVIVVLLTTLLTSGGFAMDALL